LCYFFVVARFGKFVKANVIVKFFLRIFLSNFILSTSQSPRRCSNVPGVVKTENENKPSAANQLKASINESLKRLAEAVDGQQASEEMQRYLDLLARFHKYSWRNVLLIALAKPEASLVAGFNRWKSLGRKVCKGEKAIRIFAPCPIVKLNENEEEAERVFFKTACVFDVSQTEGKDLPTLELPAIQVQGDELFHRLEKVSVRWGIQVSYQNFKEGLYGVSTGGAVVIAQNYSTGQKAKSLAHEIAHEILHSTEDLRSYREMSENWRPRRWRTWSADTSGWKWNCG
jgi:hypothetical protein